MQLILVFLAFLFCSDSQSNRINPYNKSLLEECDSLDNEKPMVEYTPCGLDPAPTKSSNSDKETLEYLPILLENNKENSAGEFTGEIEQRMNNEEKINTSITQHKTTKLENDDADVSLEHIDPVESDEQESQENNHDNITNNSANPSIKTNILNHSHDAKMLIETNKAIDICDKALFNHSIQLSEDILIEKNSLSENMNSMLFNPGFFENNDIVYIDVDSATNSLDIKRDAASSDNVNTNESVGNEPAEVKENETIAETSATDFGLSQIMVYRNYLLNIFYRFYAFFQRIFFRFNNQENITTGNVNEDVNN